MNVAIRIVQLLLGLAFVTAGFTKVFMTAAMIAREVPPWITSYRPAGVRAFGLAELAGGVAVAAAALTPNQRPVALVGAAVLAVVMIAAIMTHVIRGDVRNVPANAILLLLCVLVMWAR